MKRLTDAYVAKLKMPPGKTEHYEWDDDRQLAVRVRQRGPKSKLSRKWYKGGNVGGRWKPILIGDVRQIKASRSTSLLRSQSAKTQQRSGRKPEPTPRPKPRRRS